MYGKCKFAFCTNFSSSSLERLDLALFDIWNFNIGIDLIHLKEEDDSEQKMAALEERLKNEESFYGEFDFFIFNKSKKKSFIQHLNSDRYDCVIIGLRGINSGGGREHFFNKVITQVHQDVLVVPRGNAVKIYSRITVLLELEHIDYLHLLKKYSQILNYNCTKLTILLKSSKSIIKSLNDAFKNKVKKIIPGPCLTYDIHILRDEESTGLLKRLIREKRQDIYYLFNLDFFHKHYLNSYEQSSNNNYFGAPLLKVYVSPEKIRLYKNDPVKAPVITLRDF